MANRYWVGGSGTWNTTSTTNWSASSGGASGASVPTSADSVFFDQAATYTVTMTGALNCLDITVSAGSVTFATGTTPTLAVAGSMALTAGTTTWNSTGAVSFTSTGSVTINTNNQLISASVTISGAGGTKTLSSNFQIPSTATLTLTSGTLALGSFTLTAGLFSSSNANTRALNFGTGKLSLISATTSTIWTTSTNTGWTTSGTPLVECSGGGTAVTKTVTTGALSEANSISFSFLDSTGTPSYALGTSVFKNFIVNGSTATLTNTAITIYGNYTYTAGTLTAGTNAWTFGATSGTQTLNSGGTTHDFPVTKSGAGTLQLVTNNLTLGATRTFTLSAGTIDLNNLTLSTGAVSISSATARTIAFGTTGQITLTGATAITIWNATTISNFSYTGTSNIVANGGGAVTKTILAGAGSEAQAMNWSIQNTAGTVTFTASDTFKNLTLNCSGTTITNIAITIYGNYTYTAGTLGTGTNVWTFGATSGTQTLNGGGTLHDFPITKTGAGTLQLLTNNFTIGSTRTLTLTTGTLDLNNLTFSAGLFASNGTTTRAIAFGTGQITITNAPAASATVFSMTNGGSPVTGFTFTGTSNIVVSGGGATKTINTNGMSEAASLSFSLQASAGTVSFSAGGIVRNLTINGTFTLSNDGITLYGNYTYTTATALTAGSNQFVFAATSGTQTANGGGITYQFPMAKQGAGTLQLVTNNLTFSNTLTFTLTAGTLDLNNLTLSTGIFSSSNSNTRAIAFGTTGQITLTNATATTIWTTSTVTGFSYTGTSNIVVTGGGAVQKTITTGTLSESQALSFSLQASAGTIDMTSCVVNNLTVNGAFTLNNNALTIYGGFTHTTGTISAGTNTWTFAATSGSYNITNIAATTYDFPWTFGSAASTATWTLVNNLIIGATRALTFVNGTLDLNNKTITGASGITILGGASGSFTLNNTGGTTFTTTLAITHTSGTFTLGTNVSTSATTYTLTAGTLALGSNTLTIGTFTSDNSNVRSITGTGTISIATGSSGSWFCPTSTNFTISNTVKVLFTSTGNITINNGATAGTSTNAINFQFGSGATGTGFFITNQSSVTYTLTGFFNSFDLTGLSSATIGASARTIYGDFTTPSSGGTITSSSSAVGITTFAGTTTQTLTTNGRSLDVAFTFAGTGTYTLAGAFTTTQDTTLSSGTLNLNNFTYTTLTISSNNSNTRSILFGTSGQLSITGTGTCLNFDGLGYSYTGTPKIVLTNATASSRSITYFTTAAFATTADAYAVALNFQFGSGSSGTGIFITTQNSSSITVGGRFINFDLTNLSTTFGNAVRSIFGDFTVPVSGGTLSAGTNTTSFGYTSGTQTFTTNARTLDFPVTFGPAESSTATYSLPGNLTLGSTRLLTLRSGTLDITNLSVNCGSFSSDIGAFYTRSLTFGSTGQITINATSGTVYTVASATGFAYTGTPKFIIPATTTLTINHGTSFAGAETSAFNFQLGDGSTGSGIFVAAASTGTLSVAGQFDNFDLSGMLCTLANSTRTIYGDFTVPASGGTITAGTSVTTFASTIADQNINANGRLLDFPVTFSGTQTYNLLSDLLVSNTSSAASRTVTLTTGTLNLNTYTLTASGFASSNSNTRSITGSVGGKILLSWAGTATIWNAATSTNLSVSNNVVVETTGGGTGITKTISHGNTAGGSESTSASFNILETTGTVTYSFSNTSYVKNVLFNGPFTVGSNLFNIYGNFTVLTTNGTPTFTSTVNTRLFAGTSGPYTITTSGVSLDFPVNFNGVGGTWVLQDSITIGSTRLLTLTNGTLDLNGYTFTTGTFATAVGTKNITFDGGTLTVTGSGGTAFNNAQPTGFTTTSGSSAGTISMTNAAAKTFVGGSSVYAAKLDQGGAGTLTITGTNTFNDFSSSISLTSNATIVFPNAVTTSVNSFTLTGNTSFPITIQNSVSKSPNPRAIINYIGNQEYVTGADCIIAQDISFTYKSNTGVNGADYVRYYLGANSKNYNLVGSGNTIGAAIYQNFVGGIIPKVYLIEGNQATSWTVPDDFNTTNNTIHLWGAGAAPGGGGGYTQITNANLNPGTVISLTVGRGARQGGYSAVSGGSGENTSITIASVVYRANGGIVSGSGGTGANANGGAFGTAGTGVQPAGGGAGGPNGNGANGGAGKVAVTNETTGGAGGGGGGGGSAGGNAPAANTATGASGGNNYNGIGGGVGVSTNPGTDGILGGGGGGGGGVTGAGILVGGFGGHGADILNSFGAGGGGGSSGITPGVGSTQGGSGGKYGGGAAGGSSVAIGAPGAIVIRYLPVKPNFLIFM